MSAPPDAAGTEAVTFSFGKNWRQFLDTLTEERIDRARDSLADWLGDLRGLSFLDAGSGSGLFSFGAHALGASRIESFDIDPFSVDCTRHMHARAGAPAFWQVRQGSVLDRAFLEPLGTFDVVYSWGVLHHTGDMRAAIRNAAARVAPGGRLFLAIYNRVRGPLGSRTWLALKRLYNRLPGPGKRAMEWSYAGAWCAWSVVRLKNPWRRLREDMAPRGMTWWTGMVDWLGGLPYEFATVDELVDCVQREAPGMKVERKLGVKTLACHEVLFRRPR